MPQSSPAFQTVSGHYLEHHLDLIPGPDAAHCEYALDVTSSGFFYILIFGFLYIGP
jgi:hypothetical protein